MISPSKFFKRNRIMLDENRNKVEIISHTKGGHEKLVAIVDESEDSFEDELDVSLSDSPSGNEEELGERKAKPHFGRRQSSITEE